METTVVKGFKALEALARVGRPVSLGEASELTGLSKSNVHRLLQTLEACGYVGRDPEARSYVLTLKLWELGTQTRDRLDLRHIARPHLADLAAQTGESVHLSVFDANEALFFDKIDGTHAVRTYVNLGDRAPAYCSASGKAMLAHMPDDVIQQVAATIQPQADNTVTSVPALLRDLEQVRTLGYALTVSEWRQQVGAVSSAVRSESGKVICAIGVAGPHDRLEATGYDTYIAAVRAARLGIEADLGFRGDEALAG